MMRALSLTQPWGTMVAQGHKKLETRSWKSPWRGELAIHAAKAMPDFARDLCGARRIRELTGITSHVDYPRGVILAVVQLIDCISTDILMGRADIFDTGERHYDISEQELLLGNFDPGRYGWILESVQRLDNPVPCVGHQSIWHVPPDVGRAVREQLR